ncbi:MAG TPA: YlxR family protein [Candidatus Lumbricidophila sp.]|nr:YlxR family protein [Candidatus Lumbricidophila sp.]
MNPVRTCIGCRSRAPRSSLLRVVFLDGRVVPDDTATRPGRGAWLHPDRGCFELATRKRAFGRALRVQGECETSDLENRLNG